MDIGAGGGEEERKSGNRKCLRLNPLPPQSPSKPSPSSQFFFLFPPIFALSVKKKFIPFFVF